LRTAHPSTDREGPRDVFVEIHFDYDDDHPQRLRDRLVAAQIGVSELKLISRDDRGIVRRVRIIAPDLASWRAAQAILAATPGASVTSEEDVAATRLPGSAGEP
jgi:hypothetical protein